MTLVAGSRLGPYEILAGIGAGGMGEVYKARDTRLDRIVAIKVLPATLASDPQFRERFDREARVISQLDHPHICALYDVGEQDGTSYLVLQYLEGETLEGRLKKGALPLDQALQFAIQIADALDKAHKAGIVHRDLKPGNVMITKQGAKLLDFGLAKASTGAGAVAGLSMLPTSPPNLTAQGTILGTFQYMAPEQLEGREADTRTDIFAFGTVVYEMVTGKKAFEGKSQASLISAIMSSEPPPMASLQRLTPPALDHIVRRALAKDPDERWQTARDLWLELRTATSSRADEVGVLRVGAAKPDRRGWILSAVLALALAAAVVPAIVSLRTPPPLPAREIQFEIPAGSDLGNPAYLAISPDGRRVAYTAPGRDGRLALWVRPLESLTAQLLPDTEEAGPAEWSPDGRSLVFAGQGRLKKIDVNGGPPQTLAPLPANFRRATWNREGVILFASGPVLYRVPASGGEPVAVTELDAALGETFHATPRFLPDGRHFLYHAWSSQPEHRAIYVGSLDSKTRTRVMTSESKAMYVWPGFLLFLRERTLMARPFDVDRLRFTGEPVPVAEEVAYNTGSAAAAFAASDEGTVIYRRGAAQAAGTPGTRQWVRVDRTGKMSGPIGSPHNGLGLRLSPDGHRLAFTDVAVGLAQNVWIYDLDRDLRTRFTTDPDIDACPIWSPDGSQVVFGSSRGGGIATAGTANIDALYEKPATGAVPERLFFQFQPAQGALVVPRDWSLDGRWIVFEKLAALGRPRDLWTLPLFGDRKPTPYLASAFDEALPALSPNGRWLAYVSNESGAYQVIVQSFPDPSQGKWQISTNGGTFPRWRRDGRELYYVGADARMTAVSVVTDPTFVVQKSTPLFMTAFALPTSGRVGVLVDDPYDVTPDGQHFVMSMPLNSAPATSNVSPITVIVNWQAALGAREKR
jgi:Tol biopolymer transport system component